LIILWKNLLPSSHGASGVENTTPLKIAEVAESYNLQKELVGLKIWRPYM